MAGKRTSREEWQKRVDRWKSSGLTAREFAAETGINAGTLQFWTCKLRKGQADSGLRRVRRSALPVASSIVEFRPAAVTAETRFEIEFGNGRRLRVPTIFDAAALKTLLAILDATA